MSVVQGSSTGGAATGVEVSYEHGMYSLRALCKRPIDEQESSKNEIRGTEREEKRNLDQREHNNINEKMIFELALCERYLELT